MVEKHQKFLCTNTQKPFKMPTEHTTHKNLAQVSKYFDTEAQDEKHTESDDLGEDNEDGLEDFIVDDDCSDTLSEEEEDYETTPRSSSTDGEHDSDEENPLDFQPKCCPHYIDSPNYQTDEEEYELTDEEEYEQPVQKSSSRHIPPSDDEESDIGNRSVIVIPEKYAHLFEDDEGYERGDHDEKSDPELPTVEQLIKDVIDTPLTPTVDADSQETIIIHDTNTNTEVDDKETSLDAEATSTTKKAIKRSRDEGDDDEDDEDVRSSKKHRVDPDLYDVIYGDKKDDILPNGLIVSVQRYWRNSFREYNLFHLQQQKKDHALTLDERDIDSQLTRDL